MMTKKIFDYELNDEMELFALIKRADERQTKNGKPFLSLTFQDTSGEIGGNLWDSSEEDVETFAEGKVVFFKGKREEYNGSPQVKINQLRLATDGEPDNVDLYIERAPMRKEEMIEYIQSILVQITSPSIYRIVKTILNKYNKSFFEFPAAKVNHHAFHGGLAFHTVTMLKIAKSLTDIYPQLNPSLLFGGLLLHDIGKVKELSGPVATQYTFEGTLIGHIVMIHDEIIQTCHELDISPEEEDVVLLRHMVLSHHGKLEYGSPVRPQLLEAQILHQIDMIDANMNALTKELDKTAPGEFTNRIWSMENRAFYKQKEE